MARLRWTNSYIGAGPRKGAELSAPGAGTQRPAPDHEDTVSEAMMQRHVYAGEGPTAGEAGASAVDHLNGRLWSIDSTSAPSGGLR